MMPGPLRSRTPLGSSKFTRSPSQIENLVACLQNSFSFCGYCCQRPICCTRQTPGPTLQGLPSVSTINESGCIRQTRRTCHNMKLPYQTFYGPTNAVSCDYCKGTRIMMRYLCRHTSTHCRRWRSRDPAACFRGVLHLLYYILSLILALGIDIGCKIDVVASVA